MQKSLFDYRTHYEYLKIKLSPQNKGREAKAQFSEFLRIQPAFLSQILAQKYSLSLEQADLANQYFDHSTEESDFFIFQVSRDRAGTKSLRQYYDQQILSILKKRLLVVERMGRKATHHSNWRQRAIQNLLKQDDRDLHFSGVYSLDKKTADKIKEEFMEFLKYRLKNIESSK